MVVESTAEATATAFEGSPENLTKTRSSNVPFVVADPAAIRLWYSFGYNSYTNSASDAERNASLIRSATYSVAILSQMLPGDYAAGVVDRFFNSYSSQEDQEGARQTFAEMQSRTWLELYESYGPEAVAGWAVGEALFLEYLGRCGSEAVPSELTASEIHIPAFLEAMAPGLLALEMPSKHPIQQPAMTDDKLVPAAAPSPAIGVLVDDWIGIASKSETARKRASVELFLKAADLTFDQPASLLAAMPVTTPNVFIQLMDAVGSGWGQAGDARRLSASEIIKLCASEARPVWSQKPRSPNGRADCIQYVQRFLANMSAQNVDVANQDWSAQ